MSIWAAAAAIVGVAIGAFSAVFAKMAYKEIRDIRKGKPIQLPLRPHEDQHQHEHEDRHVHAGVGV
jgi:hypothetical protein